MTNNEIPQVSLSDSTSIPQLGYGVWQVPDDEAQGAVEHALSVGYRMIDTAQAYENEAGVGRALRASGLSRDEVYVTTKLANPDQGYDSTMRAYDESLARLGLETVDLYLIHWPLPSQDNYSATWKALVALQEEGRVRSIGVSNFHEAHLDRIIDETGQAPVINQVEMHPYLQQAGLRAINADRGIVTQSYSPLGSGKGLLEDADLTALAETKGVTTAQLVLAWHLALGVVTIPKSVTPARIEENLGAAGVELTEEELATIAALDRGVRFGGDPDKG
ncbi:aldo/keto reductase [Pseudactinotalea sp. Z1739]|uniref:aldo/keto reductase n=1 Tax=Pseudactinotalea sp. Z1739 TaxID=3413028 RepID=UPI003C7CBD73